MYEIFEQLLKERGISTYQVAKATGISTASFTGWKQGKWNFKADKLQKIADYFNVSVDYLLTGKEDVENGTENESYYLNNDAAKTAQEIFEKDKVLFDVYRSTDRDRLIAYAKKLRSIQKLEEGED